MVITDLGVFEIARRGPAAMKLIELAPGVTEAEMREKTEADYTVALAK
jgi:3-oxoacid CoA-transferase subunit B